uniref:CS domain-containing protein n=1 Tax=Peronospora matthiolae TaxID=2874970 RepID=A0AAV1VGS4_9STRA
MSESKPLWAPVKWAQRKEALYVTVDLPDVKDETVTLSNTNLTFKGTSTGQEYEVTLDFFKEVDAESKESIWAKTDRNLHFYIVKKHQDEEFWPRLLADKHLEKTNVKVDWSKFVDEDEDEGQSGFDMSALNGGGGFDINQMMAAQNASGMMGDDGSDSDDEDMPDLDPNNEQYVGPDKLLLDCDKSRERRGYWRFRRWCETPASKVYAVEKVAYAAIYWIAFVQEQL